MATFATNQVLPATYDAVWSLVLVAILVAITLAVTAATRFLRHRTAGDTVARVQALAALHASGAISDEEYDRRRERLLDQL
ncbi:SHOCT domain-containing protein [Georgenia satyanarayanai]|uniref:SHOCT domain-containing protein n=1 Tax=Georgenia satyanarayanai TaxID=860221 RepID=UPI001264971A|nr:SHOCT domain-containing protein [Georgenia satyanarayanai]